MKRMTMILMMTAALAFAACQESAIDDAPAAQVGAETTTAPAPVAAATVSTPVVKEKSTIGFVGAKVTRDHTGKFNQFDGSVDYANGQPSRIAFDIDLGSIETDTPQLTDHLKTPDFFDVAKYSKASFVSTSITPAQGAAGATHTVAGVLDMHGVKKEVSFPATVETTADGVRARSEFTINRHDWGISYKGMADDLIKDEVLIKLDLLFPPPPA
jgi:polyisoprenoid-binding protein YceI